MSRLSTLSLRAAVRMKLAGDAALIAALGGERLYDEVPRGAVPPFVTFGESRWRDWSTGSDRGGEESFVLDVWSEYRGLRQALELAERIAALIDRADLAPQGLRLVDLRLEALDMRREAAGRLARASLRFRALTESI